MTLHARVEGVCTAVTLPFSQSGRKWSDSERKVDKFTSKFILSSSGHLVKMQRSALVDPSKMGVGRAIAVLTSGGDAQGEEVCCVFRHLWRLTPWV